ncbi:MAG: carbohydate-binding domain-containing protein [Filimonas sp.]|nr:carbohydate-binding domain-containing protein [Filimonas sp.]
MKRFAMLFLLQALCVPLFSQKTLFNPGKLAVQWQVIENGYDNKTQSLSELTFTNTDKAAFYSAGWAIYFNFARNIKQVVKGNVSIKHVNGDLYEVTPSQNFQTLQPGDKFSVQFVSSDWVVNFTDAPMGFYLKWNGSDDAFAMPGVNAIPSTQPKQVLRSANDKLGMITPQDIYERNKTITTLPVDKLVKIFPTPVSYEETGGTFSLTPAITLNDNGVAAKEADYLAMRLQPILGTLKRNKSSVQNSITFSKKEMDAEAYELKVNTAGIEISASSGAGFFYGVQSLLTLMPANVFEGKQQRVTIPAVNVKDAPRFGYRAFFLDIARNFQTKEQVLKVLDLMALYKLNTFHLHFSDDEGWRIQMPSLPELTDIGAKRGAGNDMQMLQPSFASGPDVNKKPGTGFYTKNDFIQILKYANDRHIQVIPEIETPGHARAAVRSMYIRYKKLMEQGKQKDAEMYLLSDINDASVYSSVQAWNDNVMNVALPSVYTFVERVVDDLVGMYKEAGAPLTTIHMGGDEVPAGVWEKSPACAALMKENSAIKTTDDLWYYYYGKVNDILKKKQLFLSGWEEAGMRKAIVNGEKTAIPNPDFSNEHFQLDVWNNIIGWGAEDLCYKLANAGYKVVLSGVSNFYFDMAYFKSFSEPGYYWGGYVDVDKPFYFIPYNYLKNVQDDKFGNKVDQSMFTNKVKLTEEGKKNIVGVKGLLWSENNITPERVEYMMLPKLLGLAERAWAKDPEWATTENTGNANALYTDAWNNFVNILGKRELPRLDYYSGGYAYRIPMPGVVIKNGKALANIQLPGLTIRYTTDGSEPTVQSAIYTQPISAKGVLKFKAFNAKGRSGETAVVK